MSTLAERIIEARTEAGIKEPAELARRVNVRPAAAYQWESGATKSLKDVTLVDMAETLGVTERWLATGRPPKKRNSSHVVLRPETAEDYLPFPHMDLPMGAGEGREMDLEPSVVRSLEVSKKWAEAQFQRASLPHIQVFSVDGESMVNAGIHHGDLLFVDTSVRHYDMDAYYVLQFRRGWQVKRLRANVVDQCIEIVSMPVTGPEVLVVKPEQEEDLRIGGRVAAWWTLRKY